MANGDKTRVDITNRPSSRQDAHSGGEWISHFQLRENADVRKDIKDARDRLGQFTVRFVTEAIYGDAYAREVFGDAGGHELIRDMVVDRRALGALANNVGGQRAQAIAQRAGLNDPEPRRPQKAAEPVRDEQGDAQVELLRALLKMMDPSVVKKALGG